MSDHDRIRKALAEVLTGYDNELKSGEAPRDCLYWLRHDLEIILARVCEAIGDKKDAA